MLSAGRPAHPGRGTRALPRRASASGRPPRWAVAPCSGSPIDPAPTGSAPARGRKRSARRPWRAPGAAAAAGGPPPFSPGASGAQPACWCRCLAGPGRAHQTAAGRAADPARQAVSSAHRDVKGGGDAAQLGVAARRRAGRGHVAILTSYSPTAIQLAKRKRVGRLGCATVRATDSGLGGEIRMSKTVIVRYRTRPDAVQENARLVEGVFASLAEVDPGDHRYTTYRLADGVTFVHVAHFSGTENPLATLPAFAQFQRELAQCCFEAPAPTEASVVGSYGWSS